MTSICCRRATAARHQFSDQRRAHFHGCSDSPETPSYSAPRFACPLTHVPLDLRSRNPSPPRVSWTWMNPKRYARCTAAVVSDWSVSILPLRSIGVGVLASTGATIRTLPDLTLGAGSARRLSKLSTARHPSNGSEMLVSRSSAPNAGMKRSFSVVGFRNRSMQRGYLATYRSGSLVVRSVGMMGQFLGTNSPGRPDLISRSAMISRPIPPPAKVSPPPLRGHEAGGDSHFHASRYSLQTRRTP